VQQQVWSVKPGGSDWTSSPLTRPKDQEHGLISPQPTCLLPLKVNEDLCFSSPKPARFAGESPGADAGLFMSPSPSTIHGSGGKENWQPVQGLRPTADTPLKTPSRLPTVQEHDGQGPAMPSLEEQREPIGRQEMPAWVVRSPVPAASDDIHCALPSYSVKGTFIQYSSPLKTFSVLSPPKTEPVNLRPRLHPCQRCSVEAGAAIKMKEALPCRTLRAHGSHTTRSPSFQPVPLLSPQ